MAFLQLRSRRFNNNLATPATIVSTLSITKSLAYNIVLTPSAPTKSLQYAIDSTPSAKTKGLIYDIKITPSAKTKSLQYEIKTIPTALSKSLQYAIRATPSAKTKSLKYTVPITASAITKSLQYIVGVNGGRLFTGGFELNNKNTNVEWSAASAGVSVVSSPVRSGGFAGRASSLGSGTIQRFLKQFSLSNGNGPYFARIYFRVATLPTAENRVMAFESSSGVQMVYITLDSGGLLRLYDEDGSIGSASSALSLNTWYRIEFKIDASGAGSTDTAEARIDGVVFATSSTRNFSSGVRGLIFGANLNSEAQTTGDWFFDDVAINANIGTVQNNYPGPGKVIHLLPNAAGDSNTFSTQTGGTAGSANNYTRVDEVAPNDATDFNGSNTLNEEDMFNMTASGIASTDVVNVVHVGIRFRNPTADAVTAFKVQLEKTSGGTIIQSASTVLNSTAWNSQTPGEPHAYLITAHVDPDAAPWTLSTLDSMQTGYKLTTAGTNRIEVTKIWAIVDYNPITPISITKSLKYTTTITPSAITKGLIYSVKVVQAAITKSSKYTIFRGITNSSTKSLKYTIFRGLTNSATKSLKYVVTITPSGITKSDKYTVVTIHSVTKGLTYAVKPTASTTKSLKYTVHPAGISITKSIKYTVTITPSAKTKSSQYAVKITPSAKTKSLTYDVTAIHVAITKSLYYVILAKAETMSDNFDDNSIDTNKWSNWGGASVVETGSQLEISSDLASDYDGLDSKAPFDLTGSYAKIKLVNAGNQSLASWEVYPILIFQDANNTVSWWVSNNLIRAYKRIAGISTSLFSTAYVSGTHVYFRIRESGGLTYWDTSSDGVNWTNRFSVANLITLTHVFTEISAGTWTTELSTTTAKFDDYNIDVVPVSITKSGTYDIKTTPSAKTKGLIYDIRITTSAITKGLVYAIKRSISATKSLKYVVTIAQTAITKSLKYTIVITPSAITKSLQYITQTGVDITKSDKYAVVTQISKTKSLKYEMVITPSAITKSLSYIVVSPVAITKSLKYAIPKTYSLTKGLVYRVVLMFSITKTLQYDVNPPVSLTKSLKYTVHTTTSTTKGLVYETRLVYSITKSLHYIVTRTIYSRESIDTLPTNDDDLSTIYDATDRDTVSEDDGTYVYQLLGSIGDYVLHEFKKKYDTNTERIAIKWNGQTTVAPSGSEVFLQIYNFNSTSWETIDSNDSSSANIDFTLEGGISVDVADYYDAGNWVVCRVYQQQ